MPEPTWTVVMPVKRLGAAKSRLRGALPAVPHEELALALVADTVRAVRTCPAVGEILVVSDDARVAAEATAAGARVLPDPAGGLNAAFRRGAAVAGPRAAVAGLTADLPALRPAELAAALRAVPTGPPGVRGFVADAPGSGTVLLAAPAGVPLDPRFGMGSAAAHAASGALPLRGDWPTLRRDVDTAADLAAVARLSPGPRTAGLLGGPLGYGAGMQGTVATYDASTRSGVLLLDDGTELPFPARAFDASGLRLLRLGQRVRIERDAAGEIVRVTLPTMA
ncbi:2-phospho-L-lactate guanylyltransferase [Micromonospora eburnea]|uniref:Phosphoenolpyruvate guanylyltransferase n=2 Tax=Micromonosporaceae TaxID=28056 RepID=A0A1C6TX33_9ACTN|nr:2-phospho-L-lactate guanylyltransferase [Micromonospora eburnea]